MRMEGPRLFGKPMRGGDVINQCLDLEQPGSSVGNAQPDDLRASRARKAARAVQPHDEWGQVGASLSHCRERGIKPLRRYVP